eukprot:15372642-Alexandrium_andersonii.AAC.1
MALWRRPITLITTLTVATLAVFVVLGVCASAVLEGHGRDGRQCFMRPLALRGGVICTGGGGR